MMLEAESQEGACPQDVLALIPWYPDGPLSDSQRGAVETHASSCATCREEIHALLGNLEPPENVDLPPAAKVLARVLDRIDRSEMAGSASRHRGMGLAPARPETAARRSGPRRLALAAALALAAGVGALATLSLPSLLGNETYRTAAAPEAVRAVGPLIEMIPREEVSAAELRTALRKIEGEVIGGPEGTLGRYRVRLPAGADAAAAAALLRAQEGGIASYAEALHL
jgi:hypothetical protein